MINNNINNNINNFINNFINKINPASWRPDERRRFLIALVSTGVCAWIAHGFIFANEFFSHDSIDFYTLGIHFYTQVGRFFIRFYEFLRGDLSIPWLIGFLFILWMSLTGYILSRLFDLKSGRQIALICCLFTTNISITLTAATYIYCLDAYALALLCAVLAAYLFRNQNIFISSLGVIPLIFSLGLYQPYFTVTASLCLLDLFKNTASGEKILKIIQDGVKSLILLAASFIGYYALWMFFCRVFQMPPQRLDESLISQSDSLLSSLPSMLYHTNRDYLRFLFHVKISQGLLLPVLNFIIIILILIRLISFLVNPKLPILNKIALVIFIILMPTAFHSAYLLLSGGFNDLTAFANELFYLIPFLPVIPVTNPDKNPDKNLNHNPAKIPGNINKNNIFSNFISVFRGVAILCLALVIWQHMIFANQVYMKKALEKNATLLLVGRILNQIESVEGYQPGETPIAFAGMVAQNWNINIAEEEFLEVQNWTGLYNSYSATYNMGSYLTRYLHYPIPLDRSRNYAELPEVQAMPMYPAPDSIRMIDGTVVIKLSE